MAGASALFPRQQHVVATTTKMVSNYVHHLRTNCHNVICYASVGVCHLQTNDSNACNNSRGSAYGCPLFWDQLIQQQQHNLRVCLLFDNIIATPRKQASLKTERTCIFINLHTYLYYSTPSQNRIKVAVNTKSDADARPWRVATLFTTTDTGVKYL